MTGRRDSVPLTCSYCGEVHTGEELELTGGFCPSEDEDDTYPCSLCGLAPVGCSVDERGCVRSRRTVAAKQITYTNESGGTGIERGSFRVEIFASWWDYETGWHYRGSADGWTVEVRVSEHEIEEKERR